MPIKAAGIDSLKVELGLPSKRFEGLLGLIITCKDEDSFIDLYRECMPKSLTQIGLKTERIVLKGYDISSFAPGEEDKILVSFFDCLKKEVERIDIYYTRYNPKKLPKISIFGEDQPTTKRPVEFIRIITNGYPHICSYFYLSEYSGKDLDKMYVDHFETFYTPAWISLSKFKGLTAVYKGGNCNCLISSADLLLRLTVMDLKRKREDFNKTGFERIHSAYSWSKKVIVHELGGKTQILKFMTPINRRKVDLTKYISRPLVLVPLEGLASVPTKEERDLFESLPIFDDLSNFLFFTGGNFKYFKPGVDVKMVKTEDYFLLLGKNSENLYSYLKRGGSKLKRMTPERLKKENSKFIN